MEKILVIADDFTGAAELAGVGFRLGLPTRVVRDPVESLEPGLTVLDTDTRLVSAQQAAHVTRRFAARLRRGDADLIFKKTDSVLRGQVIAELETLLEFTGQSSALLVPQNPSRGRTIEAGVYYVGSVRLDETTFANDPVYPRKSARVLELLGASRLALRCLTLGDTFNAHEIAIGTGRSVADVRHWAIRVNDKILPAGGADFFTAVLQSRSTKSPRAYLASLLDGDTLFVCGTSSSQRDDLIQRSKREGVPVCAMPNDIFVQCAREQPIIPAHMESWANEICDALRSCSAAAMVIPQRVDPLPGIGRNLEQAMSAAVALVVSGSGAVPVANLLMEGGSTAAAVCRTMRWHDFVVTGEFASGVVQMCAGAAVSDAQRLVVKPGSYPWPQAAWHRKRGKSVVTKVSVPLSDATAPTTASVERTR